MTLEYLKCKICDEIEDAKDYATQAIELKPMAPTWSKLLIDMANMELIHASNLHKMFSEYYQKIQESYKEVPDYIEEMKEHVMKCCTADMAQAKYIIDMYSK